MHRPYWIPNHAPPNDFPPIEEALEHPDGLLAIGGDLTLRRILTAYRLGIFPWYSDNEPILWWSPKQRMVLFPIHLKISHSLRKIIRRDKFSVTMDQAFRQVVSSCAGPRKKQYGTWITPEMLEAYCELHDQGFAHSVESWYQGRLVGGLYGIALGHVFFGESMFSQVTDASKVAFAHFVWQLERWGYQLIDCQVSTKHLQSLGAIEIPRQKYRQLLDQLCKISEYHHGIWQFDSSKTELK